MTRDSVGEIRRSQVITTFGPGSVVDFRTGGRNGAPVSAVICGLEDWDATTDQSGMAHPQTIHEPRLERILGVGGFRLPPVSPENRYRRKDKRPSEHLRAVRFPKWLQCPWCNRLAREESWHRKAGDPGLTCSQCSRKSGAHRIYVVPVRFVTACPEGHLDEFPWHEWVGHEAGCSDPELRLESWGGAGLSDLVLECQSCGSRRNMGGCFGGDALDRPCPGRRPWLKSDEDTCGKQLRTMQRGASNLYFGKVVSALGIPPWTDKLQQDLGKYWPDLAAKGSAEGRRTIIDALDLAEKLGLDVEELVEKIERRIKLLEGVSERLRSDEYQQFVTPGPAGTRSDDFQVSAASVAPELHPYVGRVTLVTRLREIRALCGFSRIHPPDDERVELAPLYEERKSWLPAVDVHGEGLFVELPHKKVAAWANRDSVMARCSAIPDAELPDEVKGHLPCFLLLHSLAHALIRSVSLECGYSVASLRERIYAGPDMAGLLIYTATPDSDGTLGGLVQQGGEDRFQRIMRRAISDARWCASDPLCIRGSASLSERMNLGACHDCMLLPETSCEEFNRLLDRATLVGTPDAPDTGYFRRFGEI